MISQKYSPLWQCFFLLGIRSGVTQNLSQNSLSKLWKVVHWSSSCPSLTEELCLGLQLLCVSIAADFREAESLREETRYGNSHSPDMEPKSVETTVTMVCSTETIYTWKITPLIHILGCNDFFLICVPLVPHWPIGSLRVRTQEFTGSCFLNVLLNCQHTEHCWMKSDIVLGFSLVFTFVPVARKASTAHSLRPLLHRSPKERIL